MLYGAEKIINATATPQTYTRFPIVLLKPLRHLCIYSASRFGSLFILHDFTKKRKCF